MEDRLDRLRVKEAELRAEHENADTIEVPADIWTRLTETRLQEVLAGATATLAIERKGHRQQVALAERRVNIVSARSGGTTAACRSTQGSRGAETRETA